MTKKKTQPDSPDEFERPAKPKPERKEPKSVVWKCPHCNTVYRADADIARANHLRRVHGKNG